MTNAPMSEKPTRIRICIELDEEGFVSSLLLVRGIMERIVNVYYVSRDCPAE